jgi:hypothetical protein
MPLSWSRYLPQLFAGHLTQEEMTRLQRRVCRIPEYKVKFLEASHERNRNDAPYFASITLLEQKVAEILTAG